MTFLHITSVPYHILNGQHWEARVVRKRGRSYQFVQYHFIPTLTPSYYHLAVINHPPGDNSFTTSPVHSANLRDILSRWDYDPDLVKGWKVGPYKARNDNPFADRDSTAGLAVGIVEIPSFVYFITTDGAPFVKIGWAVSPLKRRAELQTGCPYRLTIAGIIPGEAKDEGSFHRQFSAYRVRSDSEWFHIEGDLATFLTELSPVEALLR